MATARDARTGDALNIGRRVPMMSAMSGPAVSGLLSAVLIVRDEAGQLPACLAALRPLVDDVVVYDTGSLDRTRQIAADSGARVVEGYWDDDFGRARTAAAAAATGTWLLVVDADERVAGDAVPVRSLLAGADPRTGGMDVRIDNVSGSPDRDGPADPAGFGGGFDGGSGGYAHWGTRLVRRAGTSWLGAVHEQPVGADGAPLVTATMPAHLLAVEHLGYADPQRVRRKAERNAELAQRQLDRLTASGHADPGAVATTLLDLGRSLIGAGRAQDALDTLETVREIVPGTPQWLEATDHLARLLLGAGHDEVVTVLSEQLRVAGADPRYCDWLAAQALAQLGRPDEALRLVRGVDELVDPAGRHYDLGQVLEVRSLLATMVGERDEALATLALAVARHGRIRGRGPLLLDLWGEAPPAGLATIVRSSGATAHLDAVASELRRSGGHGPEVAEALTLLTP